MKLLVMQLSSPSLHSIPLWSKYSLEQHVLKHPQAKRRFIQYFNPEIQRVESTCETKKWLVRYEKRERKKCHILD
jgi:hypothetical protein